MFGGVVEVKAGLEPGDIGLGVGWELRAKTGSKSKIRVGSEPGVGLRAIYLRAGLLQWVKGVISYLFIF